MRRAAGVSERPTTRHLLSAPRHRERVSRSLGLVLAIGRFAGTAHRLRGRSSRLSHAALIRTPGHHHGFPELQDGARWRILTRHGDGKLPRQRGQRRTIGVWLGQYNARSLSDLAGIVYHHPDDVRGDDPLTGFRPAIAHEAHGARTSPCPRNPRTSRGSQVSLRPPSGTPPPEASSGHPLGCAQ